MDNVIVSVSDLLKKVEELHKDGMEYVELSVLNRKKKIYRLVCGLKHTSRLCLIWVSIMKESTS